MLLSQSERLLIRLALLVRALLLTLASIVQLTPLPWSSLLHNEVASPNASQLHLQSHYDSSAQLLLRQSCPASALKGAEGLLLRALNFQAHWDGEEKRM